MHKLARKLGALFTMLALVLATVASVTPAFAADAATGKVNISSTNGEFKGKTVTAYKMFTASNFAFNGDGSVSAATYTLETAWERFFQDKLSTTETGAPLSEKAYEYVKTLADGNRGATAVTFASDAAKWAKNQGLASSKSAAAVASGNTYVATFESLAYGYYVFVPEGGSTSTQRGTDAILNNVVSTETNINLKSVYPTLEKKVEGQNHSSAQIGDTVNFTLTSAVPDMTEYDTYTFKVHDKLSKGLTFNAESVDVKVGGTTLTKGTDYTVTNTGNGDETTSVEINFLTIKAQTAGSAITVTYSATLNEKAGSGTTTQGKNEAYVEYSNNPGEQGTGKSEPSITHTYDFSFDLQKNGEGENANGLQGAEFQLQDAEGNPISLVANGGAYRPLKDATETGATSVTTPAGGRISFTGLKEGTYKLVELKAPAGYNKLSAPIEVVISATYNDDGTLKNNTVTANGTPNSTVTVVNKKGTLLPSTGGMGTVVFTVAGVAIVAAGIIWTVVRKRANN